MPDIAVPETAPVVDSAPVAVDASVVRNGFTDANTFAKWAFGGTGEEPEVKDDEPEKQDETPPSSDGEAKPEDAPEDGDKGSPAPDDQAPAPVASDKGALPFTVIGADDAPIAGEAAAALSGYKIKMTANGKEHVLPLADVVRRAQSEAGAQQALTAVQRDRDEATTRASQLEEQVQSIITEAEELRAIGLRLLTDPDFLDRSLAEAQQYMTPEARAERAEEELAATRREQASARTTQETQARAMSFMQDEALPVLEQIGAEYPHVTELELLGKLSIDTAGLMQNGVIPPSKYPALKSYLAGDLREFAKSLNAQRDGERKARETAATEARRKAQEAKNSLATALTPQGGPGGAAPAKPKIESVKDASAFALSAFAG